jgi:hypothetical protein
MTLEQPGQRGLQECWRSARRWLTSISVQMTSALSGKGGFELHGVVQPLVFFCRRQESSFVGTLHCLLFAIGLVDRQRESATFYTHTAW